MMATPLALMVGQLYARRADRLQLRGGSKTCLVCQGLDGVSQLHLKLGICATVCSLWSLPCRESGACQAPGTTCWLRGNHSRPATPADAGAPVVQERL